MSNNLNIAPNLPLPQHNNAPQGNAPDVNQNVRQHPALYATVQPPQGNPLANNNIALGDGEQRNQIVQDADRQRGFFSSIGNAFRKLYHAIAGIGATESRELRNERIFSARHSHLIDALARPSSENSLAQNAQVLDRLEQHATTMGRPLHRDDIQKMVATGENIARALHHASPDELRQLEQGHGIVWENDDGEFLIQSNLYTTRALSWYMAANAAAQDVAPGRPADAYSSLPSNGAFILKDPDNRLYTFLSQAPTCTSRMSSHVAERTATTETHRIGGLIPSGKVAQKGIEDYRNCLPGQGGSLLFDKLKNQELYVKFESVGCPAYFGKSERHEEGTALGRFFHALGRNIKHAFNFAQTRSGGGEVEGRRQEHVYKGRLEAPIYTPFKELLNTAREIHPDYKEMLGKECDSSLVKKWGLPFIESTAMALKSWPVNGNKPDQRISDMATALLQNIEAEKQKLGGTEHGIERRGAEVHLNIFSHEAIQG